MILTHVLATMHISNGINRITISMMEQEDLKPTKKYMEQGDGPVKDWKKLAAALFISAVLITVLAASSIEIFLSTDIEEKTYGEIASEINIADGRKWLADEDNRKILDSIFHIDADGTARTEKEGKGVLITFPSPSFSKTISFRYENGYLTAYQARKKVLLSFSDDMQAFAIKINNEMIIFESSF